MISCLRRTEVETGHEIEMVKIFFFFFILLSAKERQTQPILKMSSEAFAHLHYISFEIIFEKIVSPDFNCINNLS